MKPDEELRKTFKVSVDERGILNLVFWRAELDENNTRQAELVRNDVLHVFAADKDKQYNALVDITPIGAEGAVSEDGKKIYKDLARHPQLKRIALVGVTDITSKVLGFILILMKVFSRKMSWFPNKEEALSWLGHNYE